MKVFVSFIFCFSTVFGAGKVYENRFAETLVVVDETLNNKLENTTDFFGFVNTVFEPVNIEITIADLMVENEDDVSSLPFIYKFENPESLGMTYDISWVSLPLMALWMDRGSSSSIDIVVALTGVSFCDTI